jgi:hypothetical protein
VDRFGRPTSRRGRSLRRGCGVRYGPGEDFETIEVPLIREAAKQIEMAAYVLTDSAVIEALREASARGLRYESDATRAKWRD